MPTLSEMNEHANDAEHQAFQRAYDELLNVAKDPVTCRHFWDAGRSSLRRELEGQEAVAFRCRVGGPGPWTYVDHRAPDSFELRECEIQNLHLGPPPDVRELVEALRYCRNLIGAANIRGSDQNLRMADAALAKFGGGE